MQFFVHSLFLVGSFVTYLVWQFIFEGNYTSAFIGVFVFIYLLTILASRKHPARRYYTKRLFDIDTLSIFALSSLVLLLIGSSGGFSSKLFFLLYFLTFLVGFFLQSGTTFVFCALALGLFAPTLAESSSLYDWMQVLSLLLFSPIAYYFSRIIHDRMIADTKKGLLASEADLKTDKIIQDVNEVASANKEALTEKELDTLADIVKQSEELKKKIKDQK